MYEISGRLVNIYYMGIHAYQTSPVGKHCGHFSIFETEFLKRNLYFKNGSYFPKIENIFQKWIIILKESER